MTLKVKASATTRPNDATATDDPDLIVTGLAADTLYRFDAFLSWSTTDVAGYRSRWNYTGEIAHSYVTRVGANRPVISSWTSGSTSGLVNQSFYPPNYWDVTTAGTSYIGIVTGGTPIAGWHTPVWTQGFFVTRTAGDFSYQWGQEVSNAALTQVRDQSWLYLVEVDKGAPVTWDGAVVKSGDTSRSSTIVSTIDPHLQFTPDAGEWYIAECSLWAYSGTTPDFRWRWQTGQAFRAGLWHGTTSVEALPALGALSCGSTLLSAGDHVLNGSATTTHRASVLGVCLIQGAASSPPPFGLAWAQGTSAGTNTTVFDGSWLRWRHVAAPS